MPKKGGAKAFTHIQDTFTVPGLNCASTPNGTAQMRAGLGKITSTTFAQVGLNETCTNGAASYTTWYAFYPVTVDSFSPSPGDTLESSVTFAANQYTLSMHDLTSGQSFSVKQACISICPNAAAEVTAGSPKAIRPANFAAVNFHVIIATDSAGASGGLADSHWNTSTYVQSGSPHTVAGPLLSVGPPPQSAFQDTWTSS